MDSVAVLLHLDQAVTGVGGTPVPARPLFRVYPEERHLELHFEPIFGETGGRR